MLIHHFLERAAQRGPDRPAVHHKDQWLDYGALETRANRLAAFFAGEGLRRGDRIALLYENSFDYVIAYYAILKAGGVVVPLGTETTAAALAYPLRHSGARAIVTNRRFSRFVSSALEETPELELVIADQPDLTPYEERGRRAARLSDIYESGDDRPPAVRLIDRDLASIVYTSGSTGSPKGVMLTHLNTVSNTHSIVEYFRLTADDRMLVVLPFHYIYGKSLLNTHVCVGGSLVIENRFAYPNAVLDTLEQTAPTGFAGVPSTFMILLDKSAIRKRRFPALRYVAQAGGALAPALQREVAEAFAPAKFYVMYGATEAAPRLAYLEPERLPEKCGSIGKAIPNVELFVADREGRPLPPGETGELVARGSNIMPGYWRDPAATAEALRGGLYFTGDLGWMDEDGYLYVVGRTKDIIKAGGFRVSAQEVEEALLELDDVREAAVVGVDDPTLGEAIKAFLVKRDGAPLDDEAVRLGLRDLLPAYKFPKFIEFRESLPKNEAGKILKTQLKEETT